MPRNHNLPLLLVRFFILLAVLTGCDSSPNVETASPAAQVAPDWSSQAQAAITASEYAFGADGDAFRGSNRAQGLVSRLDADGVGVQARTPSGSMESEVRIRLQSWGRDGATSDVERVAPEEGGCQESGAVDAFGDCLHQVVFARPGLLEWWENQPDGLEQGFTIQAQPDGDDPLVFDIAVEGAEVDIEPDGVSALFHVDGAESLRYAGLAAWDSLGRDLPAWMEQTATGLRIVVDDTGAMGAITLDPLLSAPSWIAVADQLDSEFASSLSSAGDVNGDPCATRLRVAAIS